MSLRILPTDIEEMEYPYSSERVFEILTQLNPFFLNLRISDSNSGCNYSILFLPSHLPDRLRVTIPLSRLDSLFLIRDTLSLDTVEDLSNSQKEPMI